MYILIILSLAVNEISQLLIMVMMLPHVIFYNGCPLMVIADGELSWHCMVVELGDLSCGWQLSCFDGAYGDQAVQYWYCKSV